MFRSINLCGAEINAKLPEQHRTNPFFVLYFIYYTTLIESCQFARAIIDEKAAAIFCV